MVKCGLGWGTLAPSTLARLVHHLGAFLGGQWSGACKPRQTMPTKYYLETSLCKSLGTRGLQLYLGSMVSTYTLG
jgi:hypothetical protein